jgi:hypothetical protein
MINLFDGQIFLDLLLIHNKNSKQIERNSNIGLNLNR